MRLNLHSNGGLLEGNLLIYLDAAAGRHLRLTESWSTPRLVSVFTRLGVQVRWHGRQAAEGGLDCAQLKAQQAALVDYDLDYDHSLFGDIPDPCSDEALENAADSEARSNSAAQVATDTRAHGGSAAKHAAEIEQPGEGSEAVVQDKTTEAGGKTGASAVTKAGGLNIKARVAKAMAARAAAGGLLWEERGGNAIEISGKVGLGVYNGGRGHAEGQGGGTGSEPPRQPLSKRMRVSIRGRSADAHPRSAASIKLLVEILDWVGESPFL